MLNQLNQDPITNQTNYSDQVEELVQEIEGEVSSLIRKMILKAHTENSDGLKFLQDGNNLDHNIHQSLLRQGADSTVELLLQDIDDQKSFR